MSEAETLRSWHCGQSDPLGGPYNELTTIW